MPSGPFRFLSAEHISGAKAAFARFEQYRSRDSGTQDLANRLKLGELAEHQRYRLLDAPIRILLDAVAAFLDSGARRVPFRRGK